jgi:hypothetical protein
MFSEAGAIMTLRTAGPEAAAGVGEWACEAGAGCTGRIEGEAGRRAASSAKDGEALKGEEVVVEGEENWILSVELGDGRGEPWPVGLRGAARRETVMGAGR